MSEVIDFDARKLRPYLAAAIEGFLGDPPDTDYQRGYLSALIDVYREGINGDMTDARVVAASPLTRPTP